MPGARVQVRAAVEPGGRTRQRSRGRRSSPAMVVAARELG